VRLSAAESSGVSGRELAESYWTFCGELFVCLCVRLSAAESSGVSGRQMAERYWKFCGKMFVFCLCG